MLLKKTRAQAEALSHALRRGREPFLARRRGVVALSMVSMGAMGYIALYQMGLIGHLADPPLPHMDADAVDGSPEAYALLSTPDAVLGLGSYAATMALAALEGPDRFRRHPWIPLALAAKVGFDVLNAGMLSVEQWTRHRAFCVWCLIAAGATFATAPLVVPEARAAWREVGKKLEFELGV